MDVIRFADYKLPDSLRSKDCALICCPGKTIKEYEKEIRSFIVKNDPVISVMNNMSFMEPDIHVYTNNQRMKKYGHLITKQCIPMIGKYINKENIPGHLPWYVSVNYTDRDPREAISYNKGVIHGYYRSSTCVSIMILHILGFKHIYIAGMDGYTFNYTEESTHYYKDDEDEKKPFDEWKKYDSIIESVMYKLRDYGINFSIITPTLFSEFYKEVL